MPSMPPPTPPPPADTSTVTVVAQLRARARSMRVLPGRSYPRDDGLRKTLLDSGTVAHPAKMNLHLLRDILDRYTLPGQVILDPFAGAGSTLLAITLPAPRHVVLVELEPRFAGMCGRNYLHLQRWYAAQHPDLRVIGRAYDGLGRAFVVQHDSRRLPLPSASMDMAASSPPYADNLYGDAAQSLARKAARAREGKIRWSGRNRSDVFTSPTAVAAQGFLGGYGQERGQIGNLPYAGLDAAVTSPPFAGSEAVDADQRTHRRRPPEWSGGAHDYQGYDVTNGQIALLAHTLGTVDAAVTSPPFGEMNAMHAGGDVGGLRPARDQRGFEGDGDKLNFLYSFDPNNIGNLAHPGVDAAVTSPPYGDVASRNRSGEPSSQQSPYAQSHGKTSPNRHVDGYGQEQGQIGNLDHPGVDAAITSPPYADIDVLNWVGEQGSRRNLSSKRTRAEGKKGYGHEQAQIGALSHDGIAAAITSPPYQDARQSWPTPDGADNVRYGETEGQIGGLAHGTIDEALGPDPVADTPAPEAEAAPATRDDYASACLAVYRECYRVVRPGGVLVLVTGNYIRDGQEIDLALDTIVLALAAGWTPVERWRHEKSFISFWRRHHHRRRLLDGEEPHTITSEDVLVFCKGPAPAWAFRELPPSTCKPVDLSTSVPPEPLKLPGFE